MTTSFLLIIFILLLVAEIGIVIFKIYQILKKIDKLYDYFIRPEKYLNGERIEFNTTNKKGLPPMNGECPTKEELENF
jgi:hypothetical protein